MATNDPGARAAIAGTLGGVFAIDIASDKAGLLDRLREALHAFVFADIHLLAGQRHEESELKAALSSLFERSSDTVVIVLCQSDQTRPAIQAIRAGADSYLTYPLDTSEVKHAVGKILEEQRLRLEPDSLRDKFWRKEASDLVWTDSPAMAKVIESVSSVARIGSTVLLTGETGTGKNVLAKLIHEHSARGNKPFVSVHCGAVPENLAESELFGHEKGAFTDAVARRMGRFELAARGTVFLDEVGTMSLSSQAKLLRVLQEKVFQRVGGERDIYADVRVIAAANRDLLKLCHRGEFRFDLYYRLNVLAIRLPPLRERKEDIPHLARVFLGRLNASYGKDIAGIHAAVLRAFQRYGWPGNLRELENTVEHAYAIEESTVLTPGSFPAEIVPRSLSASPRPDISGTLEEVRDREIAECENSYLRRILAENRGRIDRTASAAGKSEEFPAPQ